jgi:hypothetical protein
MSENSEAGDIGSYRFLIMFPCFAIENKEGTGGVVLPQEDGQIACVILTDEDLVESFREQYGFQGRAITFRHVLDLFKYLRALPPEVTQVAFDPGKKSALIYPLNKLKKFLWEEAQRQAEE